MLRPSFASGFGDITVLHRAVCAYAGGSWKADWGDYCVRRDEMRIWCAWPKVLSIRGFWRGSDQGTEGCERIIELCSRRPRLIYLLRGLLGWCRTIIVFTDCTRPLPCGSRRQRTVSERELSLLDIATLPIRKSASTTCWLLAVAYRISPRC